MPRKRKPGRPKGAKTKRSTRKLATLRNKLATKRKTFRNMTHLPKTRRGRPEKKSHWILDLYDIKERLLGTKITSFPVSKKAAEMEAVNFIGHHFKGAVVRCLTIAGPYSSRPTKTTARI